MILVKHEAPSVTYTFLMLAIEAIQLQDKNNYKAAKELFTQQLILANKHPALKDQRCIGSIYLELADNVLCMDEPQQAQDYLFDAEHYLGKGIFESKTDAIR